MNDDKKLEMLMEKTEATKTTYYEIDKMLNELKKKMVQKLIDAEFEEHMKYSKGSHEEKETTNRRNGKSASKTIKTTNGEFDINTPRDREGSFNPIIVPKRKTIITEIEEQITLMYAKGNSMEDIQDILYNIYGTKFNKEFISNATKKVNEEIIEWKKRQLEEIYAIVYMDCLYVNVRKENKSQKEAVYVALGIDIKDNKDIIGFWSGDTESSSFWYGILEEIKERGVKDIIYLCSDGVSGFKEILEESYPKTIHQRCLVHIIRNMVPCVPKKEMKELCEYLKGIYKVNTIEEAKSGEEAFREKYDEYRKILIKKLDKNIDSMLNLYNYSKNIRKLIYTTNAIESVNSCLRKVTNGKGCFINEEALEKVLYLRVQELKKK